jgi:superfamily II DNA or RNA helicase
MQNRPEIAGVRDAAGNSSAPVDEAKSQKLHPRIKCGTRVLLRGRWGVVDAIASFGECAICTVAGFWSPPHILRVVTPFDRLRVADRAANRWKRTDTRAAAAAVSRGICDASALGRVPTGSGLELRAWQRVVALAFDQGTATRILLADGVGLGKTVQAGFAIASLFAREADARVLVATPAGLRDQWSAELVRLFGIQAAVLDPPEVRRLRRQRPRGASAWAAHRLVVTSIDYLKQADTCAAALGVPWDLFIVDEAHALAPDTDRHAAADAIARAARLVLLITATPHAGDDRAFSTLCRVGDTSTGGGPIVLVRRTRGDVSIAATRRTRVRRIEGSARERALHARLLAYAARVWTGGTGDPASRLAMTVLLRRAASSAYALARSLRYRRACLEQARTLSWRQPLLPFVEEGEADDADAELPRALAAPGLFDRDVEIAELDRLVSEAEACAALDSKRHALVRLAGRVREPLVVFTEYRDTLEDVEKVLEGTCPVAVLHGGMPRAARHTAERGFAEGAARVLLATDVAAEGLNLHHASRAVVNIELPWSPARLEQRIGRVDRLGQRRTVHVTNLVWQTGVEDPVLRRLDIRLASMRAALPAAEPPLIVSSGRASSESSARDLSTASHDYVLHQAADDDENSALARARALEAIGSANVIAGGSDRIAGGRIPVARIRPSRGLTLARSGIVLVFQVQRVASSGGIAAEAVIPVFALWDCESLSRSKLHDVLDAAVAASTPLARASAAEALERGLVFHDRRTRVQLRRVRSMEPGASPFAIPDPLVQPGLFDRRALAQAARERAAREALERHRSGWIARLERDLTVDALAVAAPIAAFVVR